MPWEKRYGLPATAYAKLILENIDFNYWKSNDCGKKSAAIAINPSQLEYTPPIESNSLTWNNHTEYSARLFLGIGNTEF